MWQLRKQLLLGGKPWRETFLETNLDSVLKSRDITLPTKIRLVKAMVFLVVMYRCESWTIKKTKRRRIDTFELWCWRRFLRIPWRARRTNQSTRKAINPEYSLEGLMLKLQYFGHLMQRTYSSEKTLMLGKIEGRRKRGNREQDGWMASWTQQTWVWVTRGDSEGQGSLACCSPWGCKELGTTERLNNATVLYYVHWDTWQFCSFDLRSDATHLLSYSRKK